MATDNKAYYAAYYQKHKANYANRSREWRLNNPERMKELQAKWRANNREKWVAFTRKWQRENPVAHYMNNDRRRRVQRRAVPGWANKKEMVRIYEQARAVGMEVDHIVPLKSDAVCGLHWEGNLRLVTKRENSSKGNRVWDGMS